MYKGLHTPFVRHVMTLLTGAAVAQLISLLVSPLLTRMYTPDDMGLQTVYTSWLSVLATLATARYEMAIVLPKDNRQASNLMGLSLLCAITMALCVTLTVALVGRPIAQALGTPALIPWLPLLPLSVLLVGGMQAWTNWNNRHSRYRANAQGRMAQVMAMAGVQLAGGVMGLGAAGLILGQLAGHIGSLLAQAVRDLRIRCNWRRDISWREIRQVARMYSQFPKINAPHALSTVLLDAAVLLVLTVLAGTMAVGYYGLMIRVLKLPAMLIGQAIAQVAFRELAVARQEQHHLRPMVRKMMGTLGSIALVPFIVIRVWGEPLFAWVFGQRWVIAGQYAEAMALYILFHFVASSLAMVPLVIGRQRAAFFWSLIQAVLFLGVLWLSFVFGQDVSQALYSVSFVLATHFMAYFIWLDREVKTCSGYC